MNLAFENFILDNKVVERSDIPIKLASGRESLFYVNWRTISSNLLLFDQLLDYVLSYIYEKNIQVDSFYGVPEGGTKLGLFLQYFYSRRNRNINSSRKDFIPLAMGRAKPKEHGQEKDRFFLGAPLGDTILVEDVATTGDSILKELDKLESIAKSGNFDFRVKGVLVLTDRNEIRDDGLTVKEIITKQRKLDYYAVSNVQDLF